MMTKITKLSQNILPNFNLFYDLQLTFTLQHISLEKDALISQYLMFNVYMVEFHLIVIKFS